MTIIEIYKNSLSLSDISSTIGNLLTEKINAKQEVFESLARMGNPYGGNVFPTTHFTNSLQVSTKKLSSTSSITTALKSRKQTTPNRFLVVYLLDEQFKNQSYSSYEDALMALRYLLDDRDRKPIGIYDAQTELFEWEHSLREEYEKTSRQEQSRRYEDIVNISQALRRRDWDLGEFKRPSLYA